MHDVQPESVLSTASERLIAAEQFESGGATMVIGTELEAAQTVVEYFQMTPDQLYFQRTQTSEPWPRTIGGQPGRIVTFEETHEGREPQLRGFIAVDRSRNRSYLFVVL